MVDLLLRQAVLSSLGLDNGNKEEVSEDESLGADLEEYYLPPDSQMIQTNLSNGGCKCVATT